MSFNRIFLQGIFFYYLCPPIWGYVFLTNCWPWFNIDADHPFCPHAAPRHCPVLPWSIFIALYKKEVSCRPFVYTYFRNCLVRSCPGIANDLTLHLTAPPRSISRYRPVLRREVCVSHAPRTWTCQVLVLGVTCWRSTKLQHVYQDLHQGGCCPRDVLMVILCIYLFHCTFVRFQFEEIQCSVSLRLLQKSRVTAVVLHLRMTKCSFVLILEN